jgi:hypothetical protein
MILWQSQHVDVNRNRGSVCAGRTTVTTVIRADLDDRESECRAEGGEQPGQSTRCVSLFSRTASVGWPGSAGPAHQRRREGAVSAATGGISGELSSFVDHHRDGDGAVFGYKRGI